LIKKFSRIEKLANKVKEKEQEIKELKGEQKKLNDFKR
jgi:hypothetical protein